MGGRLNLTGQTFGDWTVISVGPNKGKSGAHYCRCVCGTERLVTSSALKGGETTGCGCARSERLGNRARSHGKHTHHLYRTWLAMHDRCRRSNHDHFHRYGGRGISVCDRWNDFANFLEDMENLWQPGLTLDRLDNEADYSPENCRWATKKEQARNKSTCVYITYNGETLTGAEWAERLGITPTAFYIRTSKGWPLQKVMQGPLRTHRQKH